MVVPAATRHVHLVIPGLVSYGSPRSLAAEAAQSVGEIAGDRGVHLLIVKGMPTPGARTLHPGADDPAIGDHLTEKLATLQHLECRLRPLKLGGLAVRLIWWCGSSGHAILPLNLLLLIRQIAA